MSLRDLCAHPRGHQASRGSFLAHGRLIQWPRRCSLPPRVPQGQRHCRRRAAARLCAAAPHTAEQTGSAAALFAPDAFIRIDRNGTVTLIMCQVEMGQGIYTSISQILAEEMDVDFKHVVVEA